MKKPNWYNEQRVTAAGELRNALQEEKGPLTGDETANEIIEKLDSGLKRLGIAQAYEKKVSRMIAADDDMDACIQGNEYAILAVQRKAFVKRDAATLEEATYAHDTLFKDGITQIIHVPYQAEASKVQTFQDQANEPRIKKFLQTQKLDDWMDLIADFHQEYLQAIEESGLSEEEKKTITGEARLGRSEIDQAVNRLISYAGSKFPDGHKQASWRKTAIEASLERAAAASEAERKRRAALKASKKPKS